jgi:hypothetical protein
MIINGHAKRGACSILNFMNLGSSVSLRGFVRADGNLSARDWGVMHSSVSVRSGGLYWIVLEDYIGLYWGVWIILKRSFVDGS